MREPPEEQKRSAWSDGWRRIVRRLGFAPILGAVAVIVAGVAAAVLHPSIEAMLRSQPLPAVSAGGDIIGGDVTVYEGDIIHGDVVQQGADPEKVEEVERRLRETERRLPVQLSREQRRDLVAALADPKIEKGAVGVRVVQGDAEAAAVARQLLGALLDAGWPADGLGFAFIEPPQFGLQIHVQADQDPPHARSLQEALALAGLRATQKDGLSGEMPGVIELFVGHLHRY